ncbi:chain-length determining protein [Caulobacter sp. KR2-114]|uniref:chain-length determining protein n=1 Tax=Caulobacter sp. KR2-114 TaxID=3400912 RepID=UPI003C0526F7
MSTSMMAGWRRSPPRLFLVVVALPTLLAAVYYLLLAAPLYVSESRFVVRARAQPAGPAALGMVLQSVGVQVSAGQTDAFEVHEYMTSRDAVADLERRRQLRSLLARPEADFLARFPRPFESNSFEQLFKNYKRFVTVGYDPNSGVSTLRVQAFRAQDAAQIANTLLDGGEAVVNRLNARAAQDAISEAHREVVEAEGRSLAAQQALTGFRNRERLIDPARTSMAGLDLIGQLETQLATLRAQRASQAALAPQSAQLAVMDKQIAGFEAQIVAERARIAGQTDSLAPKIGEYERLMLERDFADKALASADLALEAAQIDARRKQLYLERIVYPNVADKAEQPYRLRSIALVFVTALVAYAIIALTLAGLREHRQGV